jgi:hypothetical protein
MEFRSGLDFVEEIKLLFPTGLELRPLARAVPVLSRFAEYVIPDPERRVSLSYDTVSVSYLPISTDELRASSVRIFSIAARIRSQDLLKARQNC